ncbi:MAG: UvrD-helicase domain-containing protein [Chloroflexi bacterium]|nr:UvrD-helicase domain-containing protein [Chloroflexota bacterium]
MDDLTATAGHPEFGDEQRRLGVTLEAIGRAVHRPLKRNTGAGDETAVLAIEAHRAWRRMQLREALDAPYFARIDFVPERPDRPSRGGGTRPVETYYIGKTYFAGDGVTVTGWQAPVASLFYLAMAETAAYLAPQGDIRGALQLKRRLVIDHGTLTHVTDDLDARPADRRPRLPDEIRLDNLRAGSGTKDERSGVPEHPVSVVRPSSFASLRDDQLRATLSGPASPWLRDIIATIQPDQYALIAAPADQILVVQGVAGSGKTSIALHRLSYLIYPALLTGKLPPRCIVFGPNRLFLKYISAVLPRLGLHRAVQTTVADWALRRMRLERTRLTDDTFEALLSPRVRPEQKDVLYRRSRLKTSRRMGTLLERYVDSRRGQAEIPDEGWIVKQVAGMRRLEYRLSAEELRWAHVRDSGRPFAVHRAAFAERLLVLLSERYEMARQARADAEAQLTLGRKRLDQAKQLRTEIRRLQAQRESKVVPPGAAPVFGAAPRFGASPPPRTGFRPAPGMRTFREGAGTVSSAPDAALKQTVRQYELLAARRQQEGEALIREAESALATALSPDEQEQARQGARLHVRRLVDAHWPPIDPVRDYHALLADSALLAQLADGLFDRDEIAVLGGDGKPAKRTTTMDLADLPAIHYLFVLSQDPEDVGRVSHDYVVIDEAQDVSELDLHCLRTLEFRQRFTLLGDMAQSIYSHRGLTSWNQVEAIFAGGHTPDRSGRIAGRTPGAGPAYCYEECVVSYRTTAEITLLANRVRRSIGALAPLTPRPPLPPGERGSAASVPLSPGGRGARGNAV